LVTAACGGLVGGGSSGGSSRDAAETPAPTVAPVVSGNGTTGGGGAGAAAAGGQAPFETTVYPILRSYCVTCHAGAGPGFPHIAHPDAGTAFRAVVDNQKVNLAMPASSRLVERLSVDGHYCWSDCAMNAAEMTAQIQAWSTAVFGPGGPAGAPQVTVPAGTISSAAARMANAVELPSTRTDVGAIALWKFETGGGATVYDTSGVAPAMHLTMTGNVSWVAGGGLDFQGGKASSNADDSKKLYNEIASGSGTQEYSVEAWVTPANTNQDGPARILTYSQGTGARNFMFAQVMYNYHFRNRSLGAGVDTNGNPVLATADADRRAQASLQHVVLTYDQQRGRRIYVNGEYTADPEPAGVGMLVNWHPDYVFAIGNETSNNRRWLGQIKLAAVYDRILSDAEIMQNFLAGASDKFAIRFALDQWMPGAAIEFEVTDFDAYSYLFCDPTITTTTPGFQVSGLRLAVNGTAPAAAQTFRTISVNVDDTTEVLSTQCTIVPKDLGNVFDAFQVWFEVLGTNTNIVAEAAPVVPPDDGSVTPRADTGIRDFDQINDTMSRITGVDRATANVAATFAELTQQLPGSQDASTFVSSHQVAIAKLALEYCDAMVENTTLRNAFFGAFPFGTAAGTVFADPANRLALNNTLYDKMLGTNLGSQPAVADVHMRVNALVDTLVAGCTPATCDAERTETVVKATCAAVLSSAPVHLQ
jgi:hypothetical protein